MSFSTQVTWLNINFTGTKSRLSKKLCHNDFFEMNTNNIKATWKEVNLPMNRKKKGDNSNSSQVPKHVTLLNYPIF